MKKDDDYELNEKIREIMTKLGFSSSRFADYIGVSRPVISHIIAKRNNPSLEIIQKILLKFPELGMEWTFLGKSLDEAVLIKLAERIEDENLDLAVQSNISDEKSDRDNKGRMITRVVVYFSDNTYTEIPATLVGLKS